MLKEGQSSRLDTAHKNVTVNRCSSHTCGPTGKETRHKVAGVVSCADRTWQEGTCEQELNLVVDH